LVRVWDAVVRLAHWSLVGCVAFAWFSRGALHEAVGYAALALVALRLVWGWTGTRYARFGQFVRAPSQTFAYARAFLARREPRYLGHNPLGGWMILALLAALVIAGATGWLSVTDRYWGVQWLQELHELCADALLALAALHVAGVVLASLRHRENLVRAMITGTKALPRPGDVFEQIK
jgi:cytochrome b